MSDQNQFEQYKQKLLHYWSLFRAALGRFWEKAKTCSMTAGDFLFRHAKVLWDRLAAWCAGAVQWLKQLWSRIRPYGRRLLQILAGWLLLAREKAEWASGKIRTWFRSVTARMRKNEIPAPEPQEPELLPPVETEDVQDDTAEIPEPEVETGFEQTTAGEPTRQKPAWMSNPWLVKTAAVFAAIAGGIKFVVKWICKLYKLILAAPVIWYAVKFAMENMERLPEEVGLDIQSTGEFARMISRQEAVYWPLGITMFCLLLMFISKKPILPWVISIFTLVLPWLIWLLNFYA